MVITFLVVKIHDRIFWNIDLGPYRTQPEYTHPNMFRFIKPQRKAFVQDILDKNSKIPCERNYVKEAKTCQLMLRKLKQRRFSYYTLY